MASKMNESVDSPQPPKPIPKPGKVKVVRALYSYTAQHADELSFEKDQVLYVTDLVDANGDWWKAKCGDKTGLIPSNYVEDQTEEMELPLHEAARRGNKTFLQNCLRQGVSATRLDPTGNTPLYWAARAGHMDCVDELLKYQNSINAQNKMGDSPLHIAASHGHLDVVNLLLKNGADPLLKNNDKLLPEDLANSLSIKNAIQMSKRMHNNNLNYGYGIDDYNDDSD